MNKSLAGRSILIVEDEMLVLMNTEDMLSDLGCRTTAAATVAAAIALIDENEFDAALLDMNLNGDGTFAVADTLAARGVPFAFATGYAGLALASDHAARPLLRKPFHAGELGDVMERLLPR